MKIDTSEISLKSENASFKVRQAQENIKFWVEHPANKPSPVAAEKSVSKDKPQNEKDSTGDTNLDYKIKLLRLIMKEIYNKEFDFIYADYSKANNNIEQVSNQAENSPEWKIKYERKEISVDYQSSKFDAEGIIKTTDGKQISFQIDVNLEFSEIKQSQSQFSAEIGKQKKDPLIINFDGTSDMLDFSKFEFDLDKNGILESIPFLKSGSGFLALDKNNDGKIGDGSELFGPSTGNGFEELAKMDYDKNGWIDENDDSFKKLNVWEIQSNGYNRITPIKQKGVEAIFLGNAATNFYNKNQIGNVDAELVSTGIYINNQNKPGLIKQVDFIV